MDLCTKISVKDRLDTLKQLRFYQIVKRSSCDLEENKKTDMLHAADCITGVRILCSFSMLFCKTFSPAFYTLYLICGISDVLDGELARRSCTVSEFGAKFDTFADIVFFVIVLVKILYAVYIPKWLTVWIAGIAFIKCANIVTGLVLYRHFIAEHTVMNKICGVILFVIIPLCTGVFSQRTSAVMIVLTCAASTFAAVQEWYYILNGNTSEK